MSHWTVSLRLFKYGGRGSILAKNHLKWLEGDVRSNNHVHFQRQLAAFHSMEGCIVDNHDRLEENLL